jgi:hypothetical protein
MAWTAAQDVLDAWIGDDEPTDSSLVAKWIDKAEREIRFRIPGIQTRITAAEVDLIENVVDVVVAMVARVFRNPDGTRSMSTGEGPFTEQRTFGGDTPGTLTLTSDELEKLRGASLAGRASSIDMIPSTSPFFPVVVV